LDITLSQKIDSYNFLYHRFTKMLCLLEIVQQSPGSICLLIIQACQQRTWYLTSRCEPNYIKF